MPVLEHETVLRGKGVHSGVESSVRFHKRDDEGGPRFFWPGWSHPLSPKELGSFARRSQRATVLTGPEGQIFRTSEHLLAACLFCENQPVDIRCEASEPPGLDGSALPFFNAMIGACPEAANPLRWRGYDSDLKWEYDGKEGWIQTSPSDSFSVDFEWNLTPLKQRFVLKDVSDAVTEILPARTFISYRDWSTAKDSGTLLAGVNTDSGLLLAESREEFELALQKHPELQGETFPLLHPRTFRQEDEPVRHKILDLMGDLALLGLALPRLRIKIRNGGHSLNHLLLEKLFDEQRTRI